MRFLGLDLAWKAANPSGAVRLEGTRFPLRLVGRPETLGGHAEVLDWIARRAREHRSAIGIDAPLLGLERPGRRACDDAVSRAFGRFHASTHSPPAYPDLRAFTRRLAAAYGTSSFDPVRAPRRRHPALREVYPNALQVLLFDLEGTPGATLVPYKRRRFATTRAWAERGLGPFVARCASAIGGRYVDRTGPAWRELVADRPTASMTGPALKAIEDRWDAVLCALAVALEFLTPGVVRLYPADGWAGGAILAPVLRADPGPRLARRRPLKGRP